MDQNLKSRTLEKLTKAQNILVVAPQDSGFDVLASALSIYLSTIKLGKNTAIIAKPPTVSDANNLYGVDKIGKSISNSFVIVIDDAISSVDKVTHFLDKNQLKISVHPLAGSKGVSKEQVSFEKGYLKPDFIFAMDFESLNQLKQEITHEQNIDPETWIISVNKKSPNQKFAQVAVSSPDAASLCEITTQLLQEMALPLDEDIAFNLYSGISYATNNFALGNCTSNTFQIASYLVKFGAAKASFAKKNQRKTDRIPEVNISKQKLQNFEQDIDNDLSQKTHNIKLEEVEREKVPQDNDGSEAEWLKPPKIFRGANSFDKEY